MILHKWDSFVVQMDIGDGVYAITMHDDVLDPDCWPVHSIQVRDKKIINQACLYRSSVYDIPDMVGWTTEQLSVWLHVDTTGSHPEEFHSIMQLSL